MLEDVADPGPEEPRRLDAGDGSGATLTALGIDMEASGRAKALHVRNRTK